MRIANDCGGMLRGLIRPAVFAALTWGLVLALPQRSAAQEKGAPAKPAAEKKAEPKPAPVKKAEPAAAPKGEAKSYLGVAWADTDRHGVTVTTVYRATPAVEFGIRHNDRIVSIDGTAIETSVDAAKKLDQLKPGATAAIVVMRHPERMTIKVTLGNLDDFRKRF